MRIHLRKRIGKLSEAKIKKGSKRKISLYLAFQESKKKTKYEWLKLYLIDNPTNLLDKEHNKETIKLAEAIRAKRLLHHQTTSNGFVSNEKGKISFLDFFEHLTKKKADGSNGNGGNWKSALAHLKAYCNGQYYTLENIDDFFIEGFKEYLVKEISRRGKGKISPNSALSYFNKLRAALREAFMSKMIKENPCLRIKGMKGKETHRQFLTFEELQKLFSTECVNPRLKKAFIFSALTGLRWSDVKSLTWGNVKHSESNGWSLEYTQQKTKRTEVLPVPEQAIKMLGEKTGSDEPIFKDLTYHAWMGKQLQRWIEDAEINKKITFHCARHSFATLQLSMDTDIYTVSKMLGHRHLKTTEIYAKVIDKKKIDAANRIPELIAF